MKSHSLYEQGLKALTCKAMDSKSSEKVIIYKYMNLKNEKR